MESARLTVGQRLRVTIEKVAHGGHFIARSDGAVLFVRHAIPGEDVTVEITEVTKSFARADVVEIHSPSADRVSPPCRYAGTCGGCDFQHISYPRQLQLKSDVIKEQFQRIAKMDLDVPVEQCGTELGWRIRATATADVEGKIGFYQHRSHTVVPVHDCLVMHPSTEFSHRASQRYQPGEKVVISPKMADVSQRTFTISDDAFWQGHIDAPATLTQALLEIADFKAGDHVFDLYSGVGLFTSVVLDEIGLGGRVDLIESSEAACADAIQHFKEFAHVHVHHGSVEKLIGKFKRADIVVLDPPRDGAGKKVIDAIVRLKPREIVYISCDPASLARDTGYLRDSDYMLEKLRAFDLFPMTQHIESIALYRPIR